ncbi:hypothetical protein AVEN_112634-1 [Araneus ventricosus]|uniref:Transposase n=1 Tax=Araneus ventricosus TaxID=182803 RepID=A0A4Y2S7D6_ARAVE|nr:hypothetical protein AVEN_112634-1 [Araneus ventricosus]
MYFFQKLNVLDLSKKEWALVSENLKKIWLKKLYDNKTISLKGRLTDNIIDQLSVFYGNAIRQHSNSAKDMRNAVWAIYFHTRSTDNEHLHSYCPAGGTSSCKYNQAVSKGSAETFRHKNRLPPAVMDAIKPIFNSLSHPELLNRCHGAYTQNTNESLNSVIGRFALRYRAVVVGLPKLLSTNQLYVLMRDA